VVIIIANLSKRCILLSSIFP